MKHARHATSRCQNVLVANSTTTVCAVHPSARPLTSSAVSSSPNQDCVSTKMKSASAQVSALFASAHPDTAASSTLALCHATTMFQWVLLASASSAWVAKSTANKLASLWDFRHKTSRDDRKRLASVPYFILHLDYYIAPYKTSATI